MTNAARILIALALLAGLASSRRVAAAGGSAEGFAQLKTLVGHWEEQKASEHKATLDIELTSGGTTLLERFHMVEQGKPVEMIPTPTSPSSASPVHSIRCRPSREDGRYRPATGQGPRLP